MATNTTTGLAAAAAAAAAAARSCCWLDGWQTIRPTTGNSSWRHLPLLGGCE